MLQINCPWCGTREGIEFHYQDEAHIMRPLSSDENLENWSEYMHSRKNVAGWQRDLWQHTAGCRRFFFLVRNSMTDEIAGSYKIGEDPLPLPKV